jgi:type IV secretory pathway VirB2 component (pilin)
MKYYFCKNQRKMFKVLIVAFSIIICMAFPFAGFAQTDPGCDPLDPLCPIDGGLSLLIAAGIGIGAKKAYDRKKSIKAD